MPDLTSALAENRAAVDELVAAADLSAANWTTPRGPGKWSPAQVVEHVARSLEEGGNVVAGRPSKLPSLPAIVRPLPRFIFNRAIRTGSFPKAKTNKPMNPAETSPTVPATPSDGRSRLQAALAVFDRECRERAAAGRPVVSPVFGKVSVEDYAKFTELHTRHHTKQITGTA